MGRAAAAGGLPRGAQQPAGGGVGIHGGTAHAGAGAMVKHSINSLLMHHDQCGRVTRLSAACCRQQGSVLSPPARGSCNLHVLRSQMRSCDVLYASARQHCLACGKKCIGFITTISILLLCMACRSLLSCGLCMAPLTHQTHQQPVTAAVRASWGSCGTRCRCGAGQGCGWVGPHAATAVQQLLLAMGAGWAGSRYILLSYNTTCSSTVKCIISPVKSQCYSVSLLSCLPFSYRHGSF